MIAAEGIARFLEPSSFGVVGASADRAKYGKKVLRCYLQNGRRAVPVNPGGGVIEGIPVVERIAQLPAEVQSLSIVTPPEATVQIVAEAAAKGIRNLWMQPGAESREAIRRCEEAGINVIADGSCILVVLGFREL